MAAPTAVDELRRSGAASFARAEYGAAVRDFSRALALEPDHVALLCNRSAALLRAGGAADALRDAEAAERAARASVGGDGADAPPKVLYRQAQALAELGHWDAVVAVCARALRGVRARGSAHVQLRELLRTAVAAGADASGDAVARADCAELAAAALACSAEPAQRAQPAGADPAGGGSEAAAAAAQLDAGADDGGGGGPDCGEGEGAGAGHGGAQATPAADPAAPALEGRAYVEHCRARANGAYREREFGQAVAWYTHALAEAPADAVCLSNRAAAYLALGRHRSAARDAWRAARLQPAYLKGNLRAALCALRAGRYARARAFCLRALDASPSSSAALGLLDEARQLEERSAEVAVMADDADAAPTDDARAAAFADVRAHAELLLASAPLDGRLAAAHARALCAAAELDEAALACVRARERGARGPALRAERLLCLARDGPRSQALALARAQPPLGRAEAWSDGDDEEEDGAAKEACDDDAMSQREAEDTRGLARLAHACERVLALDAADARARELEAALTDDDARAAALAALEDALRACEPGGATEAGLQARVAAVHADGRDYRAGLAACEAGLRASARRAAAGEGAAARKALHLRAGLCAAQLAEHAQAAAHYRQALALDPAHTAARRGLHAAERALRLRETAGLYATLGVPVGASDAELRRAYHVLALRHHPDRQAHAGEPARIEAEERFKAIAAAFEVLSDPERRARYDVDMHLKEAT